MFGAGTYASSDGPWLGRVLVEELIGLKRRERSSEGASSKAGVRGCARARGFFGLGFWSLPHVPLKRFEPQAPRGVPFDGVKAELQRPRPTRVNRCWPRVNCTLF